jgi:hypothetical protein
MPDAGPATEVLESRWKVWPASCFAAALLIGTPCCATGAGCDAVGPAGPAARQPSGLPPGGLGRRSFRESAGVGWEGGRAGRRAGGRAGRRARGRTFVTSVQKGCHSVSCSNGPAVKPSLFLSRCGGQSLSSIFSCLLPVTPPPLLQEAQVACGWVHTIDNMEQLKEELTSAQAEVHNRAFQLQLMCEVRGVRTRLATAWRLPRSTG